MNQSPDELKKTITALERQVIELQDALIQEQKENSLKSQFIGTAAHEFRTPLTAILNSADFLGLVGRTCHEAKYHEHIAKIQQAVHYLAEFSEDVLTLSKIEISNSLVKPSWFNIYDVATQLIDEISSSDNYRHTIFCETENKNRECYHDKHLLQHVMINLIENAVKYSPHGSEIRLIITFSPRGFSLAVEDHGRGILEEDQQQLFEPFVRGTNNTDTMGTGLGLSIVKKSVEAMNGSITIRSVINSGTCITVTIPLITEP